MQKIAVYGKGGIGKSTICSNLSAVYAEQGLKVLHVGCDPKHDSTIRLLHGRPIMTVIEAAQNTSNNIPSLERIITKGVYDIDCIECGGPKSGVGCAGRGVSRMFEILEDLQVLKQKKYDVVIFDVLGDVVCGGFAAPLKKDYADKVFIVVSEEIMSLYAANKISQAVLQYEDNGVYLGGVIMNCRDNAVSHDHMDKFLKKLNVRSVGTVPRSKEIMAAEKQHRTVVEAFPKSEAAKVFRSLAAKMLNVSRATAKRPAYLEDADFNALFMN